MTPTRETDGGRHAIRHSVHGPAVALFFIVGLAAVLRVWGIKYGLPAVYNPDEVAILTRALAFSSGDLNPHNFLYPTLYFYVLFGWIGAYFLVGVLTGVIASLAEFERQFFHDPTNIYLAGRLLGALIGTASVLLIYKLGLTLSNRAAALLAALFLAVSPVHVQDSHYIKHDVALTALVLLACLMMARLWSDNQPSRAAAIGSGAAIGLAVATHYYGVFLIVPLVLGAWLSTADMSTNKMDRIAAACRTLAIASLAALVTFFICSPFVILDYQIAWRDIVANREIVVDRAIGTEARWLPSAGAYLKLLWSTAFGWPLVILASIGAIWVGSREPARMVWLASFAGAFFLFLANTVPATRRLNPLLPTMCLFAGMAVSLIARSISSPRRTMVAALLGCAAAIPGAVTSIKLDMFFTQEDTRTQALRWIERHVPSGSSVLIQPYSVPLVESVATLRETLAANLGDVKRASRRFQARLKAGDMAGPTYRLVYLGEGGLDVDKLYKTYNQAQDTLDQPARGGIRYVVVKRYNKPDVSTLPFYDRLSREGQRLATFTPYRQDVEPIERARIEPYLHNTDTWLHPAIERPGPVIEIWKI